MKQRYHGRVCLFLNFSMKIEIESSQKVAAERHCILEYEKKRERKREREREREFVEIMS